MNASWRFIYYFELENTPQLVKLPQPAHSQPHWITQKREEDSFTNKYGVENGELIGMNTILSTNMK